MKKGVGLISVSNPSSVIAEQFNTIRTNIEFSNVDRKLKSIVLTSSTASEGKSTVAANLAVSFARQGKKVLLVDADLRRPTLEKTFGLANPLGVTNYLTEDTISINDVIYKTTVDNLYIIPSGPTPPNPSELIGSRKMEKMIGILESTFDLIIYDAPPVLSVTDAQLLANKVDGVVVVVRVNKTEKENVRRAIGLIKHVGGRVIGTILNDVEESTNGYYGYYKKD